MDKSSTLLLMKNCHLLDQHLHPGNVCNIFQKHQKVSLLDFESFQSLFCKDVADMKGMTVSEIHSMIVDGCSDDQSGKAKLSQLNGLEPPVNSANSSRMPSRTTSLERTSRANSVELFSAPLIEKLDPVELPECPENQVVFSEDVVISNEVPKTKRRDTGWAGSNADILISLAEVSLEPPVEEKSDFESIFEKKIKF